MKNYNLVPVNFAIVEKLVKGLQNTWKTIVQGHFKTLPAGLTLYNMKKKAKYE